MVSRKSVKNSLNLSKTMILSYQLSFVTLIVSISICGAVFPYPYPRLKVPDGNYEKAGTPLIITPFLRNGSIEQAQKASRVSITDDLRFKSHAGFFTVDEKYNSNLYFWYFAAFSKKASAPVVLWLQGGPGGSSLFGLFMELGPLVVDEDGFYERQYHWAQDYHLIFIDNPVGTGFSFTENSEGYCNDEDCIGAGLHEAMRQFYQLFPHLKSNDFYITGESYAGKYIPALAIKIHEENMLHGTKINLKGLAMGNAYCDPINQMDYGEYLYQHGLLDSTQRKLFKKYQAAIAQAISKEDYLLADTLMDTLMDGDLGNFSYFKNFTGFDNYYNFLKTKDDIDGSALTKMLSNSDVRRSVHVGNATFNDGTAVLLHLTKDILRSVAPWVAELLSHYRVLVYNGQLDIIVAYPLTEKFLSNLNFTAAEEYKSAKRKIWRSGDSLAGYYKTAGNLTEVLIRDAGHMVPRDQPKWALDLITTFIDDRFK